MDLLQWQVTLQIPKEKKSKIKEAERKIGKDSENDEVESYQQGAIKMLYSYSWLFDVQCVGSGPFCPALTNFPLGINKVFWF